MDRIRFVGLAMLATVSSNPCASAQDSEPQPPVTVNTAVGFPWLDHALEQIAPRARDDGGFPAALDGTRSDVEATASALLAMTNLGITLRRDGGKWFQQAKGAAQFLRDAQDPSSGRIGDGRLQVHALGVFALADAGLRSGYSMLREPVADGVRHLAETLDAASEPTTDELAASGAALTHAVFFGVETARRPCRRVLELLVERARTKQDSEAAAGAIVTGLAITDDEPPADLVALALAALGETPSTTLDADLGYRLAVVIRVAAISGSAVDVLNRSLADGRRKEGELEDTWPAGDGRDLVESARRIVALATMSGRN